MKVRSAGHYPSTHYIASIKRSLNTRSILRSALTVPLAITLIVGALIGSSVDEASAAPKKNKKPKKPAVTPIAINAGEFVTVTVKIPKGKKKVAYTVACYQSKPGTIGAQGSQYLYTPYKQIIALAKWKANKTRSARDNAALALKQKISRAAKCGKVSPGNPNNPGNPGNPNNPNQPELDHLSLEPYTGPFGVAEAQLLFDRFAWGASPERIQQAVADGLEKTVQDLLTIKDDSAIDAVFEDYACDARPSTDKANKECSPINPNDFSFDGLRYGTYAKVIYGNNPYFMRMYFFLMDKWMAGVTRNATGCYQHAIREHHDMLLRNAFSGDFMQFTREYTNDLMGALIALNLRFSTKFAPNEDWAREIMERGTIGKATLEGAPNYTDADVAEMARVYTGWKIAEQKVEDQTVCYAAWVSDLHDATPKRIFIGTPYEATVTEPEDVLQVLFKRPETADRMAHQIWTDFINDAPTNAALRKLAAVIRAGNYNIHTAMGKIMRSKALYAAASRKTLIKHPTELIFGFLRQTGIPYEYSQIHSLLNKLGQTFLNPPTVFGWNAKDLADEFHTLSWTNGVNGPIFQNLTDLEKKTGFNWVTRMFAGIPSTGVQSVELAKAFANRLGVSLTPAQLEAASLFLDFDVTACPKNSEATCANSPKTGYYRYRRLLDLYPNADSRHVYVTQALLSAYATSAEYRLK